MALRLPQAQALPEVQRSRYKVPVEQILAVEGQNPLAQGINAAVPILAQALQKRAEIRRQAAQVQQLAQLTGQQDPGAGSGLSPEAYLGGLKAKADLQKSAQETWIPYGIDPKTGMQVERSRNGEIRLSANPANGQMLPLTAQPKTPAQMELEKAKMDLAQSRLNFQKEKMTMPTAAIRSMGETAVTVLPHIEELKNTIHEAAQQGFIGPVAGRVYGDFLAGKVGSTGDKSADALLGKLRAQDSLVKTAMLRTHFGARGGQQMYEHFANIMNTGVQSEEEMMGALDVMSNFAQGYAHAGGVNQNNFNAGGAASFDPKSLKVPTKSTPGAPAPAAPSSAGWTPAKEARYQELIKKKQGATSGSQRK